MINSWRTFCLLAVFQSIQLEVQPIFKGTRLKAVAAGFRCNPRKLFLPEWTYSVVPINSSSECCALCESDSDCNAWSRSLERSLCGLKNGTITFGLNDTNYRSGLDDGIDDIDIIPAEEIEIPGDEPGTETDTDTDSMEDEDAVPDDYVESYYRNKVEVVPECQGIKDRVFSVAPTIGISSNVSAKKCCKQCRDIADCFSWNWFKEGKICFLSGEIGTLEERKGAVSGSIA